MPVIKVGLSSSGVNQAIRQVESYKKLLNRRVSLLMEQVVQKGAETARVKVAEMGAVRFGELIDSIEGLYDPNTHVGIIRAGAPHAIFVEFGTGVVGAGSPHPDLQGWKYDTNNHGEKGWWYWDDTDNNWHWTKGMPSRPFMWETAQELQEILDDAKKAVFG